MIETWIVAFLIAFSIVFFIISIPSFISIFKFRSEYFKQIRLLRNYKKVSIGYKLKYQQNYKYVSSLRVLTRSETMYYFPIILNKEELLLISKGSSKYSGIEIEIYTFNNNQWNSNKFELKNIQCLYVQILNGIFRKKIDKVEKESIEIDDIQNLNDLLNKTITSIRREDKLKTLLNG